jgi:hypothetical protein
LRFIFNNNENFDERTASEELESGKAKAISIVRNEPAKFGFLNVKLRLDVCLSRNLLRFWAVSKLEYRDAHLIRLDVFDCVFDSHYCFHLPNRHAIHRGCFFNCYHIISRATCRSLLAVFSFSPNILLLPMLSLNENEETDLAWNS